MFTETINKCAATAERVAYGNACRGVLADEDKARHHRGRPEMGSSLHEKFVDILLAAKPHLCVCDMFHAAEGQAPAFGDIVEMGLCVVSADTVVVEYAGEEVARHAELAGSRGRSIERSHLLGGSLPPAQIEAPPPTDALLRPLAEYEALVGGGW